MILTESTKSTLKYSFQVHGMKRSSEGNAKNDRISHWTLLQPPHLENFGSRLQTTAMIPLISVFK